MHIKGGNILWNYWHRHEAIDKKHKFCEEALSKTTNAFSQTTAKSHQNQTRPICGQNEPQMFNLGKS